MQDGERGEEEETKRIMEEEGKGFLRVSPKPEMARRKRGRRKLTVVRSEGHDRRRRSGGDGRRGQGFRRNCNRPEGEQKSEDMQWRNVMERVRGERELR